MTSDGLISEIRRACKRARRVDMEECVGRKQYQLPKVLPNGGRGTRTGAMETIVAFPTAGWK